MGITETGFSRKTYSEILDSKIAKAKELFGEDIDTSDLTPLGKYLRINAYDQSLVEEEAEMIYYSIFPNTATGTSLDRLCVFAGITRNAATYSKYTVLFTGTAGKTVPAGFLVSTDAGIEFETEEEVTVGENGTVEATVYCTESGEVGNVQPSEISIIVNPSTSVESVSGVTRLIKGEDTESDYELRRRFDIAKDGLGACNENSILAALMRVPTVSNAGIVVNETDGTDEAGRPARSFECYVNGGEDYHLEIAEAIFSKKPMGIKTWGDISQEITDIGGYTHEIKFSHTAKIPVYVRMAIKTTAEFEGDAGREKIRNNLATYIDNIGVGTSVIFSSLYGQIHDVAGVQEVTELLLSTDGASWSTSNVTTTQYQVCHCEQVEIKANDDSDYEVV